MVKKAKWFYIICSILLCVLGICLIMHPALSAVVLCYVLGGILVVCGIAKIFGYFSHDLYNLAFQFDLALGIFVTIVGVVLLLCPDGVLTFFPIVIGLFIMIDGVFKLQTSLDAKRFGLKSWWLVLLGAILCVLLSGLLLINPFKGNSVLMILIGTALLVDGLQNLFSAVYTVKILKRERKGDSAPIDVDDFEVR